MRAMNQTDQIPEYVDTETPLWKWYVYNIIIFIGSLVMAYLASLILEYELAKLAHPQASFIITPRNLDLSFSFITIVLGLANLSVLLFVFLRHLWLRKWMLGTMIAGWMLLAILALTLSSRFLTILLPSTSMIK
jgi:hypothetical protein